MFICMVARAFRAVSGWLHTDGIYEILWILKALVGESNIFCSQNNNVLKLNITILATQHKHHTAVISFHYYNAERQIALIVLLGHTSLFHKKSHIAFPSSP